MGSGFSLLRMYWTHEPLVIEVLTKAGRPRSPNAGAKFGRASKKQGSGLAERISTKAATKVLTK